MELTRETRDNLMSRGLAAHKICWEDTGRNKNSSLGPNISDLTLCYTRTENLSPDARRNATHESITHEIYMPEFKEKPCIDPTLWGLPAETCTSENFSLALQKRQHLCEVIRRPNFADYTDDIPIDEFKLCVGNEKSGGAQEKTIVSLKEYLEHFEKYSDASATTSLLSERDNVVLTSSQCCIVPVEKGKKTDFCVQLKNYGSFFKSPKVLVIMASEHGTSASILTGYENQKLFFNNAGKAHWMQVERAADRRERESGVPQTRVCNHDDLNPEERLANTLLIIQVPLKAREVNRECLVYNGSYDDHIEEEVSGDMGFGLFDNAPSSAERSKKTSGLDMGLLSLGQENGEYPPLPKCLERDHTLPIRCTVQYYRASDENFLLPSDCADIAAQIDRQSKKSVASGSLVTQTGDQSRETSPGEVKHEMPQKSPWTNITQLATFA